MGTIDLKTTYYGCSKTMILGASDKNIYLEEIELNWNNLPFVMESLMEKMEIDRMVKTDMIR